jgi:hypothetical protein
MATAFMLREGEDSLSVNWLEELKCPNRLLRVLHEPEPDDSSHAGIHGIPYEDQEIVAELIAQVVLENHPARA